MQSGLDALFGSPLDTTSLYDFFIHNGINTSSIDEETLLSFFDYQRKKIWEIRVLDESDKLFSYYPEQLKEKFVDIATSMLADIFAVRWHDSLFTQVFVTENLKKHYVGTRAVSLIAEQDKRKGWKKEEDITDEYDFSSSFEDEFNNPGHSIIQDSLMQLDSMKLLKNSTTKREDIFKKEGIDKLKKLYAIQKKAFDRTKKEVLDKRKKGDMFLDPFKILARLTFEINDLFTITVKTDDYLAYSYINSMQALYGQKPIYEKFDTKGENNYINKEMALDILQKLINDAHSPRSKKIVTKYSYNGKTMEFTKKEIEDAIKYFSLRAQWTDPKELKKYKIDTKISKITSASDYIADKTNLERKNLFSLVTNDEKQTKEHLNHYIIMEVLLDIGYIDDVKQKKWELREIFFRKGNVNNVTIYDIKELVMNPQIQNLNYLIYSIPQKQYKRLWRETASEMVLRQLIKNSYTEDERLDEEEISKVDLGNYENYVYNYILEKTLTNEFDTSIGPDHFPYVIHAAQFKKDFKKDVVRHKKAS